MASGKEVGVADPTPNSPAAGAGGSDTPAADAGAEVATAQLVPLLTDALRALGDAGEPVVANRIAGRAWAVLRHADPAAAQRINGLMHRLARQESAAATAGRR